MELGWEGKETRVLSGEQGGGVVLAVTKTKYFFRNFFLRNFDCGSSFLASVKFYKRILCEDETEASAQFASTPRTFFNFQLFFFRNVDLLASELGKFGERIYSIHAYMHAYIQILTKIGNY